VVCHLEEIGPERPPLREETLLRRPFHVPRQKDGAPSVTEADHDRIVVPCLSRARATRCRAGRVQHLQPRTTEPQCDPAARPQHGSADRLRRPLDRSDPAVLPLGADPDRFGAEHPEDRRPSCDVVAVRVGEDEEIQPQHSEGAQSRRHDTCPRIEISARQPARVDEHRPARREPHQDRVPLPDIEDHDIQASGGPRQPAPRRQGRRERDQEQPRAPAPAAARQERSRRREQEEQRDHPPRGRLDEERGAREIGGQAGAPGQETDERRRCGDERGGGAGPQERQWRGDRADAEARGRERHRRQVRDDTREGDGVEVPGGQRGGRDKRRGGGRE